MKFRKKPIVIEAIQYDGTREGAAALSVFAGHWISVGEISGRVIVTTPSGAVEVVAGDWLIRGNPSDYYPCKADVFAATYEPAD